MDTFLFYIGNSPEQVNRALTAYQHSMRAMYPELRKSGESGVNTVADHFCGWALFEPTSGKSTHFVSQYQDTEVAVVAFGASVMTGSRSLAEVLAEEWKSGDITSLRGIDVAFGCVILDLVNDEIYVFSDYVGLRSLHYTSGEGQLWVSPHTISLVLAGACEPTVNSLSWYSTLRVKWSLGGAPLLQGADLTDPQYYYNWKGGKLQKHKDTYFNKVQRLDPLDKRESTNMHCQ